MSEKAEKLIQENLKSKHTTLDLSNCELDGTEDDLYQKLSTAKHLEILFFSNNSQELKKRLGIDEKKIDIFDFRHMFTVPTNLQGGITKVRANVFVQIPNDLPPNLQHLYISGTPNLRWSIRDISSLAQLNNLQFLELASNNITDILPLFDLPLYELDIRDNIINSSNQQVIDIQSKNQELNLII